MTATQIVPVAVRAANSHADLIDPCDLNQTPITASMLGDDTGNGCNVVWMYVDLEKGENLVAKLAHILKHGRWPGDGGTHCNYMFPNWVQASHISRALNGDYSFWCPRQGIHVSPGQTKKPMRADTGIYVKNKSI